MTLPIPLNALYVADTHAVIWYLKGDAKLGASAHAVFQAAARGETQIVISAITIAEMYYANQKHKLFTDFVKTYRDLKSRTYIQIVNFNPDDVLEFDQNASVPEMHDRIITGLARRIGAPLLTHDQLIAASSLVPIVW